MKCFIYRNLHKKKYTYSIKALEGPHKGKVIGYGSTLTVNDVEFKVSEAGRKRCVRERKKNVHAGVVGNVVSVYNLETRLSNDLCRDINPHLGLGEEITYNPYKHTTFVKRKTEEPVYRAAQVQFWGGLVEAHGLVTSADPTVQPQAV